MRNRKDISEKAEEIFSRVDAGENLTQEDAVALLQIGNYSSDFYRLIAKANELSRKEYGDRSLYRSD